MMRAVWLPDDRHAPTEPEIVISDRKLARIVRQLQQRDWLAILQDLRLRRQRLTSESRDRSGLLLSRHSRSFRRTAAAAASQSDYIRISERNADYLVSAIAFAIVQFELSRDLGS
jgi:hypothetical protein